MPPQASVMIVDDDVAFARAAADVVVARGMRPVLARSVADSRSLAAERSHDLVLLDLNLPDGSAFDALDAMDVARHGHIALVTGCPSVESAARAVGAPIVDYLIKPLCPQRFDALLTLAANRAELVQRDASAVSGLIGQSPGMIELSLAIHRVAPTDASILIVGETGTGKEVVAQAIHKRSGRPGKCVSVNCGAIAPELMASQLFGHEKGSFTGAHARHFGYVEQAEKGTLFLDEITEMPAAMQVYLLRVLESRRYTRVGGLGEQSADVRVVAATNRDPLEAIREGRLREDLFYRLADLQLQVPPLRQRGRDVVLLAEHFLDRLNAKYAQHKRFAPGSDRLLASYAWPGNVRELRSLVQRAFLLATGDLVAIPTPARSGQVLEESESSIHFTVGMSYAEIEEKVLLKTLAYHNHDRAAAAKTLGVHVRTIQNQLGRIKAAKER